MAVLVNTQSEQDFIDQYNKEIEESDAEIEKGIYISHEEVEQLFQRRRKDI